MTLCFTISENSLKTISFHRKTQKLTKILSKQVLSPTAGELDNSFNVSMDFEPGEIRSSARQADGKIIIGGFFRTLNDARYKSIARLNTDNSLDSSFSIEANGTVFAIAIQADGKILIGGSFTVVNGTNQRRIARLNADGSIDLTFDTESGANNNVIDIAVQPDGKILVGGSFDRISSSTKYFVARLNADGSIDNTFTSELLPSSSSSFLKTSITRIALQNDGKILLGGRIISDADNDPFNTVPIIRLNLDGSIDSTFELFETDNSNIFDIVVLPDGKILIAGFIESINGGTERKILHE